MNYQIIKCTCQQQGCSNWIVMDHVGAVAKTPDLPTAQRVASGLTLVDAAEAIAKEATQRQATSH